MAITVQCQVQNPYNKYISSKVRVSIPIIPMVSLMRDKFNNVVTSTKIAFIKVFRKCLHYF